VLIAQGVLENLVRVGIRAGRQVRAAIAVRSSARTRAR
jgi:hypothetical protein